jgi:hypothetical protein
MTSLERTSLIIAIRSSFGRRDPIDSASIKAYRLFIKADLVGTRVRENTYRAVEEGVGEVEVCVGEVCVGEDVEDVGKRDSCPTLKECCTGANALAAPSASSSTRLVRPSIPSVLECGCCKGILVAKPHTVQFVLPL